MEFQRLAFLRKIYKVIAMLYTYISGSYTYMIMYICIYMYTHLYTYIILYITLYVKYNTYLVIFSFYDAKMRLV